LPDIGGRRGIDRGIGFAHARGDIAHAVATAAIDRRPFVGQEPTAPVDSRPDTPDTSIKTAPPS
jgi:hypothetical protein